MDGTLCAWNSLEVDQY